MVRDAPKISAIVGDFTLGDWLIQPSLGRISREGTAARIRPQLLDLLVCLARHPGRTLTKNELLEMVWPGQYIQESGLARCITEVRQALGDQPQAPCYIETIPKRGYRLIAPVRWLDAPETGDAAPGPAAGGSTPDQGLAPAPTPAATVAPAPAPAAVSPVRRRHAAWWAAGAIGVVVLAAVAAWQLRRPAALPERGAVVVVFDNATRDPVFDGALGLALAIQLEQSPLLAVLSDARVRDELRFMGRQAGERLTRPVAREVCQRAGAKALMAGSIAALGQRYVIGLEGVACQSGAVIVRQQVEIDRKEDVLDGLGRAVSGVRERLGESLASIRRSDVPIIRATTASLEALKAVSLGDVERAQGRDAQAIQLYRQAVEIDPAFALAHERLGVHLLNMQRDGEAVESLKKAFALAGRVSVPERYSITGFYYSRVVRDPFRAIEAFQTWRDLHPHDPLPRLALASLYIQTGRFEKSLQEGREAERLDPNNGVTQAVVAEALLALGRFDEARRVGEALAAGNRASANVHQALFEIAFVRGDAEGMRRELDRTAGGRETEAAFLFERARAAAFSGRLASSGQLWEQASTLAAGRGDATAAALNLLEHAKACALVGLARDAAGRAAQALSFSRAPQALIGAAMVQGLVGDTAAAERLADEYRGTRSLDPASDPETRPVVSALVNLRRHHADAAIEALAPTQPFEAGGRYGMYPALVRGLAHEEAGRAAQAAAEFRRIVNDRGAVPIDVIYPVSHLHLARALASVGDTAGSRDACRALLALWKDADAGLPALDEARKLCGER